MARSGMHDEPGRFIDDDQVLVLVKHAQLHRLGLQTGWNGCRDLPTETIARPQPACRTGRPIVEADVTLRDQPLDLAPALPCEKPGQVLAEPWAVGRDSGPLRLRQAPSGRPLPQ